MAKNVCELIILKGPQEGKKLRFQETALTIGRVYDNDVVVNSPAISDHHCRLFIEEGHYIIEDLNSMNGTFLNNKKIQKQIIRSGDKLEFGSVLLLFMRKGEDRAFHTEMTAEAVDVSDGPRTVVMDGHVRDYLLDKEEKVKEVSAVSGNPLIITLLFLIVIVWGAIIYFWLTSPSPEKKTSGATSASLTAQPKPTESEEAEPTVVLPRIERGNLSSSEIIARAKDHFEKGKMNYQGRKLKDANLFMSIDELKQSLAYLELTDQEPNFAVEVQPLLQKAVKELHEEYKEILFLARKLSRQENFVQARDYYELIKNKIPDQEDERYQTAARAINYLVGHNLVK